jgi:CCR4-NOT transcription complex subunit 1
MSMSNNVRALSRTLPGDGVPEGVILMFVNDNIDVVCRVIEEAAEKHSIAEIENQIREAVHVRQLHRSSHNDEGFNYPQISKWAYVIPEPYKPLFGGLRPEQLTIYEDFGPSRNMTSHVTNASQDPRQQITDVIQDQFSAVPNLATPAEAPAVLRQATQHRILPGPGISGAVQPQMNGFNEPVSLNERVEGLFSELLHAAREAPEDRIRDLGPAAPMREIYEQLAHVIDVSGNQRDNMAMNIAHRIPGALFQESQRRLEIEVAVQLLSHLSQLSMVAARSIALWLAGLEEDRIFNAPVTACLVSARLLDLLRVDMVLSKALRQRKHLAIECLADMVEEFLLSDHPLAIRANFAHSFEVLVQWVHDDPDLDTGKAILRKLQIPESTNALATLTSNKQDQIEHVFEEWLHLNRPDVPEKMVATFIRQLYLRGFLKSQEDTAVFLRLCLDISVAAYEQEEAAPYGGSIDLAYLHIDALCSLIVSLVVYQGIEADGAVKPSSAEFLDSILSILVLYQAHHYSTRAEVANQKIFFRLYSGLLCDIHTTNALDASRDDMYLVMARAFLAIQPDYFPGFAFAWLGIITHRLFMPVMITMPSELVSFTPPKNTRSFQLIITQAIQRYTQLLHITFQTLRNLVSSSEQAGNIDFIHRAQDYHRAVLRILVVIHHDFPDFLVENHLNLCNSLPETLVQLKNLVLSAVPSSFPELPSPFSAGLKVDLLPEMRLAPAIRNDFVAPLRDAGILRLVDNLLATIEHDHQDIDKLCLMLQSSSPANLKSLTTADSNQFPLIHALVMYMGFQGISASKVQVYTKSAPHAALFFALVRHLRSETRCQLIHAMVNQLRFPNSHTHYFMCALIDIFCMPPADKIQDEIQEVIVRTLLERLAVQRPHPWGVIVALLELYKNGNYQFWDLPFVKASPEVRLVFGFSN